jgi:hypothetical protein
MTRCAFVTLSVTVFPIEGGQHTESNPVKSPAAPFWNQTDINGRLFLLGNDYKAIRENTSNETVSLGLQG